MVSLTDLPNEIVEIILRALPPLDHTETENQKFLAQLSRVSEIFRIESQSLLIQSPILSSYSSFSSLLSTVKEKNLEGVRRFKFKNGSYISYAEPERQIELDGVLRLSTSLEELVYEDCRILASSLFGCPTISKLVLIGSRVHPADPVLLPLLRLNHLSHLIIMGCMPLDFQGLLTPSNVPNLIHLYLEHVTKATLALAPIFPQIEELCTANLENTPASIFPALAIHFEKLKRLEITKASNLATLEFIEKLPSSLLEHLRFKSSFAMENLITLFQSEELVSLSSLKGLWIPNENEEKEGVVELKDILRKRGIKLIFLKQEILFEDWLRLIENH